jgi:serine/threonine protein kinase
MTEFGIVKARADARIGTALRGKYFLERVLGIGGSASVFAATHRNGSRVAVKVLHPEFSKLPDVRMRFLREGYVANKIAHPGVVKVLDDDTDADGSVFLVMELLEGETLDELCIRSGNRLPLAVVLVHIDRVLGVLEAANACGVAHRDVKPENIFLTTGGELKVLDFGIARLLDGTGATQSGQLFGTPAFMAPEQAGGRMKDVDGRTDIWSVGASMFSLLSGKDVHEDGSFVSAAIHRARSLRMVAPEIPSDVIDIVDTALAFEMDRRWPTARSMQAALRATGRYEPASSVASAEKGSPERRGLETATLGEVRISAPTVILGSMDPELMNRKND